ncbi:hypothetical protein [Modestobacter sp. I12A-02662]|uniref:hypothetical protein n=1 Tax=Modestobacter sp. I12A-02662 TaxID=1730496 RepID=UPI0034DEE8FB
MRTSHATTALAAFIAGLTTAAALRRLAGRLPATAPIATDALLSTGTQDAVVLPFARPVVAGPALQPLPASPARCGDSGGRTKAGAPCGARTTGGRCHHHALAA